MTELPARRSVFSPRDAAAWRRMARDFATSTGTMVAIAAVLAFLVQPFNRFVAPADVELAACMWAMGSIGMLVLVRLRRDRPAILFELALLLGSIVLVSDCYEAAIQAAKVNDVRCAAIQHHMLAGPAGRADDAAMFSALGCRPQGNELPAYR